MASFASFIDSAANLSVSADERTYTITGDWNWDGALDDNAFPRGNDGITIILSGSNAKLRCSAGASGTFGGYSQPIRIVENPDAHNYPNDNGSPASPTDCRFVGAGTSIWDNIIWNVKGRPPPQNITNPDPNDPNRENNDIRSDFDVGRNFSGTFRGFRLIQEFAYDTNNNRPFNHIYTSNLKLEIDENGLGYSIRNERNAHAMIIESNPNAQFEGLASDNVDIPVNTRNEGGTKGSSARIVVNIPANTTFTLIGLDTATLTQSSNNSTSVCKLVNPRQIPTLTNNWNSPAGATTIIERDQPFNFTGAVPTGTLYADSQAASNGEDASVAIPASGQVSIRCRTHYSAYTGNATGGTFTDTDSYRFHATGFGFAKYFSGTTNISVGTSPTTRNVSLTAIALPDGTALASKTSGAIETASDLVNALHSYEVANPTYPALATRLLSISGSTVQINTAELVLSTSASDFITRSSNTITIQTDSGGIDASNGIGLLNLGSSYNAPSGTLNLIGLPTTSSQGTSALINIIAPANWYGSVFTNAGVQLGVHSFTSAGTQGFLVPANQALANTRVGCGRAGYPTQSRNLDISAGGTFNVEFQDLAAEVDANGNALLDSSVTKPSISFVQSGSNSGQATFLIGNQSYSPKGLYRALHDQYSNPLGARFAAFGRQNLQILEIGGAIPPAVFLGSDCQLRRASSSGDNAAVNAFVLGGISGNKINSDRGPIETGGSISTGGGGSTDLTEVNTKLDAIQTSADVLVDQAEHITTSLPLSFPTGSPLSPLCTVVGLAGMSIIRDVESRGYAVTPSGVALDTDAKGIMTFSGTNSHIDLTLSRTLDGVATNFTKEIIALMNIKPTQFNSTEAQPLFSIGAALVSIAPSTGDTAALRIGVAGAQDSVALLNRNAWNDVVVSFEQQDGNTNYPIIRVSVNGAAQEKWNDGSNQIFASITSSTTNFRIGARSTGGNTSVGWIGEARALWVHPNNEVFSYGGANGWEIPSGIYWSERYQLYLGAHLADRVEGVLSDIYEPIVDEIAEKTYTLEEQAAAVLTATRPGIQASNANDASLIALAKYSATQSTAPTAAAIADAVWDENLNTHTSPNTAGRRFLTRYILADPFQTAAQVGTAGHTEIGNSTDNADFTVSSSDSAAFDETTGWITLRGLTPDNFRKTLYIQKEGLPNPDAAANEIVFAMQIAGGDVTDGIELFGYGDIYFTANSSRMKVIYRQNNNDHEIFTDDQLGLSAIGISNDPATQQSHTIAVSMRIYETSGTTYMQARIAVNGGTPRVHDFQIPAVTLATPRLTFNSSNSALTSKRIRNIFFDVRDGIDSSSESWQIPTNFMWDNATMNYTGDNDTRIIVSNEALVEAAADSILNSRLADHTIEGTLGEALNADNLVDKFWDENLNTHTTPGSAGARFLTRFLLSGSLEGALQTAMLGQTTLSDTNVPPFPLERQAADSGRREVVVYPQGLISLRGGAGINGACAGQGHASDGVETFGVFRWGFTATRPAQFLTTNGITIAASGYANGTGGLTASLPNGDAISMPNTSYNTPQFGSHPQSNAYTSGGTHTLAFSIWWNSDYTAGQLKYSFNGGDTQTRTFTQPANTYNPNADGSITGYQLWNTFSMRGAGGPQEFAATYNIQNMILKSRDNVTSADQTWAIPANFLWDDDEVNYVGSGQRAILDNEALTEAAADATWNALLADHSAVGTAGKKLGDLTGEEGINIPTARQVADAVWDETIADHSTAGSAGHRLQATSTHDEPADSPQASDVADAVWNRATSSNSTAGSFGAKLGELTPPPTAAAILAAFNNETIIGTLTGKQVKQIRACLDVGAYSIVGNQMTFNIPGTSTVFLTATVTTNARGEATITFPSD